MTPQVLPAAATRDALQGLADIATPAPVSWMPQTWSWAALAAVVGAGLIALLVRWRRHALANRYRAEALRVLATLEGPALAPDTRAAALVQVAELIKRTALATHPRVDVARLSGRTWAQFVGANGLESPAAAALLEDGEYRSPASLAAMSETDTRALVLATRAWIKEHRVPA